MPSAIEQNLHMIQRFYLSKCVPGQCGTGNVPAGPPVLNATAQQRRKTARSQFTGNSVKFWYIRTPSASTASGQSESKRPKQDGVETKVGFKSGGLTCKAPPLPSGLVLEHILKPAVSSLKWTALYKLSFCVHRCKWGVIKHDPELVSHSKSVGQKVLWSKYFPHEMIKS